MDKVLTATTDVAAAFAAGSALCDNWLRTVEGVPAALIPDGFKLETLERLLPQPQRIKSTITLTDADSFIRYWQTYADDKSVLFSDLAARKFRAVFDYQQPGQPAWGDFRAELTLRHTSEWKTWTGKNNEWMPQITFAEFIELHALDVIDPISADLVLMTQTLQMRKKVSYTSGQRLHDGRVQLTYVEEQEGTAGPKGDLRIPEKIMLALRVFEGCEKYQVPAFLRYRIGDDRQLKFMYQIERPERIVEDAFGLVCKQLEVGCTGGQKYQAA